MSAHQRETQSLLADNQRLAAAHVALKQELSVALQDHLRYFSSAAGKIKAERDAEVREVFEKAIKMEAEVRLIDELSADLIQVRGDVQKLSAERKEVNEKLDNQKCKNFKYSNRKLRPCIKNSEEEGKFGLSISLCESDEGGVRGERDFSI